MHEIIVPKEIKFSEMHANGSLSPNNFKRLSILNKNVKKIREYLLGSNPYTKGKEPGASAYVNKSEQIFLRNSCINTIQYSADKDKYIYLNPNYYDENMVDDGDVLLCTDANIGDCCLFISDNENITFSSGIVKLNFIDDNLKYYVLAFLRDNYFRKQLDAKTPKGSTIRHSGELFLDCEIPDCNKDWVIGLIKNLVKNISYAEYISSKKMRETEEIFHNELIAKEYDYINPSFNRLNEKARLDSGIYSNTVFQWHKNTLNYKGGFSTLEEFGFKLKRGPNLAKRDLGRSIQQDTYRKGYNILIYPSDISSSGYIEKVSFLGARNKVWFLGEKDILFSAEGTVGKTFIICDNTMKFTTNFHGTIVSPVNKRQALKKSVFLGLYLNYLRACGVFRKMSVGGNGGSFAVGYWDNIIIPNFEKNIMDKLLEIYTNEVELKETEYIESYIRLAGIYELNNFLIRCKVLLSEICSDLKNDALKAKENYVL